MYRFIIIVFALWMPLTQAADLDKGTRAFENGDYRNARYELEPLADAGDTQAQAVIGLMHALGRGYRKDLVQAYKWLTLSARAGNEDAQEARERIATGMTRAQLRDAQSKANRFRPTPLAQSDTVGSRSQPADTLPTGRALVAEIQAGLSRLGYEPGTADGLIGRRTTTAITDFQRQVGLRADGQASKSVLLAIRKAESDGRRASRPAAPARTTTVAASSTWYYTRQDLDGVMKSLRSLLASNDNNALRSGVTNLLQRGQWPWNKKVFRDDFKKAAGHGGLDWQVIRGEFSIDNGLLSDARSHLETAPPPPPPPRKRSDKEQILGILGALLGTRVEQDDPAPTSAAPQRAREPDEVHLVAATSRKFLFRARVLAQDPARGMTFALQRTVKGASDELRLRYDANAQQLLIEHATGSRVRQIAAVTLRLEAGRRYNFEWARMRDGLMQVALNGRLLISDARNKLRGSFDGFAWRNRGGSYLLTEVEMYTRRRK